MSRKAELLIKEAESLSYFERVKVVDELLATLEPERDKSVDEAWAIEIERRAAELVQGTVVPVVWDEVKRSAVRRAHGDG